MKVGSSLYFMFPLFFFPHLEEPGRVFLFMIEVCSQDGPSVLSAVQGCSFCRVLAKYEVVNVDDVHSDNQVIAACYRESRVFNTSFYDTGV